MTKQNDLRETLRLLAADLRRQADDFGGPTHTAMKRLADALERAATPREEATMMTDEGFKLLAMLQTLRNVADQLPEPAYITIAPDSCGYFIDLSVDSDEILDRYAMRFGVAAIEKRSVDGRQFWMSVCVPPARAGQPRIEITGPHHPTNIIIRPEHDLEMPG